jgi:hypothetical protein
MKSVLNKHCQDVGCEVFLVIVLVAALVQEGCEYADQVFFLFFLVTPLDPHQILNSASVVLQDAVNQQQSVSDECLVSLHLLYYLKK